MPGDQDIQCPPWVMRRQLAVPPYAPSLSVLPEASYLINWEPAGSVQSHVLEFVRNADPGYDLEPKKFLPQRRKAPEVKTIIRSVLKTCL
jgi:hypothetical protein